VLIEVGRHLKGMMKVKRKNRKRRLNKKISLRRTRVQMTSKIKRNLSIMNRNGKKVTNPKVQVRR